MDLPDLDPLRGQLDKRVTDLDETQEKAEERNKGDASDPAMWKKVEPKIRRDVVEDCIDDLEEIEDSDDLYETVAEWRRSLNEEWRFKTTNQPTENERNSIKQGELRTWKDELVKLIPEEEFSSCGICGSDKMPKSDRRRKKGYTWECPDCSA